MSRLFYEGGIYLEIKIVSASKAEMKQIEIQANKILQAKNIDPELWRHEQNLKLVLENIDALIKKEGV